MNDDAIEQLQRAKGKIIENGNPQTVRERILKGLVQHGVSQERAEEILQERFDRHFTEGPNRKAVSDTIAADLAANPNRFTTNWIKNILSGENNAPKETSKEKVTSEAGASVADVENAEEEVTLEDIFKNPDSIKNEAKFREIARDPAGSEELRRIVRGRASAIDFLKEDFGLSEAELAKLEHDSEIEGWTLFQSRYKNLIENIDGFGKMDDLVLNVTWWNQWRQFVSASERYLVTLEEYGEAHNLMVPRKEASSNTAEKDGNEEPKPTEDEQGEGGVSEKEFDPQNETSEEPWLVAGNHAGHDIESQQNEPWLAVGHQGVNDTVIVDADPEPVRVVSSEYQKDHRNNTTEQGSTTEGDDDILELTPEMAVSEYQAAKAQWEEKRRRSEDIEADYRTQLAHFYRDNEKGLLAGAKRFFGIQPELPEELQKLSQKTIEARVEYKAAAADLVHAKYADNPEQMESVGKRYERILAQHILIANLERRNAIQSQVVEELYPEGTNVSKTLRWLKKTKNGRRVASIAAYTLIGLASGGTSAALVAGGSAAVRLTGGALGGALFGKGTSAFLERFYVKKKEAEYQEKTESVKDIFDNDLATFENELAASAQAVTGAKRNTRIAAASAAAIGGLVGGSAGQSVHDYLSDLPPANVQRVVVDLPPRPRDPGEFGIVPEAGSVTHVAPPPPDTETVPVQPQAQPEVVPKEYVVQKGDNVWNILEGKGPDAHPVGGMSEVVKDMPLNVRNRALDTLVDYMEKNPDFTKSVGISGGDPHSIFPDENIRTDMLDAKMRELIQEKDWYQQYLDTSGTVEAPHSDVPTESVAPDIRKNDDVGSDVLFGTESNVDQAPQVPAPHTEETSLGEVGVGAAGIGAFMRQRREQRAPKSELDTVKRSIIESIEGPKRGSGILSFFMADGETPRSYDSVLKKLTLQEFNNIAQLGGGLLQSRLSQLGVDREQFTKWGEWIENSNKTVPINMNETLDQYVERVAGSSVQRQTS